MSDIRQESDRLVAVQNSEEFRRLRKTFRGFVFPMTAVFLGWYLLYVLASGWWATSSGCCSSSPRS